MSRPAEMCGLREAPGRPRGRRASFREKRTCWWQIASWCSSRVSKAARYGSFQRTLIDCSSCGPKNRCRIHAKVAPGDDRGRWRQHLQVETDALTQSMAAKPRQVSARHHSLHGAGAVRGWAAAPSDIYALRLVLYEMATASIPFAAQHWQRRSRTNALSAEVPPPSRHNSMLPAAFGFAVLNCLRRTPQTVTNPRARCSSICGT